MDRLIETFRTILLYMFLVCLMPIIIVFSILRKKSIFYESPAIYMVGMQLIHGRNLDKRYAYIAEQIGYNAEVLEPGCGPALLARYLKSGCVYRGFDINREFVEYAQRAGLSVKAGNAVDPRSYVKSDVVVLCDLLHHIDPVAQEKVLKYSLSSARRKLIICEPFKIDSLLDALSGRIKVLQRVIEVLFSCLDNDGGNGARLEYIKDEEELRKLMEEGFNVIPQGFKREIVQIGHDLIAVYYLTE